MISYAPLWETMKKRGITQYQLINTYGVSPGQLTRLRRNESVSTHTIEMFCLILDCKVENVMKFIKDKENEDYIYNRKKLINKTCKSKCDLLRVSENPATT